MNVVTMTAIDLTLLKTSGTLQRLYNEGGLSEATVFVERLPREFSEGPALVGRIERGSGRPVIEFPVWSRIAHG